MFDPPEADPGSMIDPFDHCVSGLLRDDAQARRRLAVTAGHSGAGTSTVSVQLALALARRLREPVALVDANLRRPSLHTNLGLERSPGLSNLVEDKSPVDKVAHHSSQHPNLAFITIGDPVQNPLQFFDSHEFQELLSVLNDCYRIVVFDCPALGPVPEAEILVGRVGTAILVLEAENTRWEVAKRTQDLMNAARVEVAGVILNRKRHFIPNALYNFL